MTFKLKGSRQFVLMCLEWQTWCYLTIYSIIITIAWSATGTSSLITKRELWKVQLRYAQASKRKHDEMWYPTKAGDAKNTHDKSTRKENVYQSASCRSSLPWSLPQVGKIRFSPNHLTTGKREVCLWTHRHRTQFWLFADFVKIHQNFMSLPLRLEKSCKRESHTWIRTTSFWTSRVTTGGRAKACHAVWCRPGKVIWGNMMAEYGIRNMHGYSFLSGIAAYL